MPTSIVSPWREFFVDSAAQPRDVVHPCSCNQSVKIVCRMSTNIFANGWNLKTRKNLGSSVEINSLKIFPYEINPHEINSHEINSPEVNSNFPQINSCIPYRIVITNCHQSYAVKCSDPSLEWAGVVLWFHMDQRAVQASPNELLQLRGAMHQQPCWRVAFKAEKIGR